MKTGLRIVAVCFVFGVCLAIGGALAAWLDLHRSKPLGKQLRRTFAAACRVLPERGLRSSWRGLRLAGVLFAATYGISTVSTQVESLFFLSAKMPPGLIRALFVQGAIAMALFAPLAVLILGKWRAAPTVIEANESPPLKAVAMTWRILLWL